ncbi:uncharacterized protein LOC102703193 [Oryza brachyantha]|uniref:Uncharacterized protein n=1 Tax=Oryza brachyantha TaxID=4533 RepID=J3LJJ6_ORYBR|nr:uncharacterized protein LOC102703193 [Oryza brachyantha]
MAAISPHLASTLPPLRTPPRRLLPAVSVVPPRAARVVLRGFRLPDPAARSFLGFQKSVSLQKEHQKQVLFASDRDSTSTGATDDNLSSPDGPPVLTILAGVIVFLLVLWVIGSVITWITGLVFAAAKS